MRQSDALKELGLSRTTFWRLRKAGMLRDVVCHRTGRGKNSAMLINVPAVRLALCVHLPVQR